MKDLAELVFVPAPGAGHLASAVEMAKLLVARDLRLSVTVLILKFPVEDATAKSLSSSSSSDSDSDSDSVSERIKFVELPRDAVDPAGFSPLAFLGDFFESQKPRVRDAVEVIVAAPGAPRLAGFVLDMFCSTMVDVADEFGAPSYTYLPSGAGSLGLMFHLQGLIDEQGIDISEQFKNEPGSDLSVPGFVNRVSAKFLPDTVLDKVMAQLFFKHSRRIRRTKGILVNTFMELEPNIINSLYGSHEFPPVYPVGPIVNHCHVGPGGTADRTAEIITWLDEQPHSSVVFLCFGSMGSFGGDQVREIALALEQSGVRFVWSLRQPPQKRENPFPSDYANPAGVLPAEFLDRTALRGKIVGWAPQVAVLAHPAIGGFVSHCGCNSILESLWYGVPIATWPMYAEQQFNAFEMVKELGLAVEITLDYRKAPFNKVDENEQYSEDVIVKAEEIKRGIERVMEQDSEIRKSVKEMSEKSRKALLDDGSSHTSLSHFINDVVAGLA